MALDRRIIAIFCFSFLGFTMIMVLNDYNCPYEYVDTFEAKVVFAHIEKDSVSGSFSRRLLNYRYFLELNCSRCDRKIEGDYELYREFIGRTGVVLLKKYHRPSLDRFEYEIISWTVNN